MVKVVAQVSHPDTTGASLVFRVIEVEEQVTIFNDLINNTHRYWVPLTADVEDEEEYLEPVDDPDYNFRADFAIYRQQYNFMEPTEIQETREILGLAQSELAVILGIDLHVLADIEANFALQPYEQEVKLSWLKHPEYLLQLVKSHPRFLSERCERAGIDLSVILTKLINYENKSHIKK